MIQWKEKIKARLGPLWWYAAVMFLVQRVGDVINIYTGLWLVPKWVPQGELGALLPMGQIGAVLGLPLAILLIPFTKYLNTFGAREEIGKVKALLTDAFILAGISAFAIAAYTWFSAPFIFERLRISGTGLIWLLCGIAITSAFLPIVNNGLQALKLFRCMGFVGLAAAPVRLFFLVALLPFYALFGFFSAQFLSNLAALGISFWGLRHSMSSEIRRHSYRVHLREMLAYTLPIAGVMIVGSIQMATLYLVIRQRLPDVESAAFYFGSRFSEIPNILWSAVAVVFFPVISEAFETGRNTRRMLVQVLVLVVGGGGVVAFGLWIASDFIFGLVRSWQAYRPFAYLVGWMALSNVLRVGFACFTTHEMACRRFGYMFYAMPIALLEAAVLVSLTGYGFFAPYLSASWVAWMGSIHAARLDFIIKVTLASSVVTFIGMIVHLAVKRPTELMKPLQETADR
jgi:O-antigen/teichoic acid export membrane protein